jgi:hypothetical protein
MLLDLSVNDTYIEDCEVCCNPIQVSYAQEERALTSFRAEGIEQ